MDCRRTAVVLALLAPACTWAPLRSGGEAVAVVGEKADCVEVGQSTARTRARIGPFRRNAAKVRTELETLARNEAGNLGGDAILAIGAPVDGEQRFLVLRCADPTSTSPR